MPPPRPRRRRRSGRPCACHGEACSLVLPSSLLDSPGAAGAFACAGAVLTTEVLNLNGRRAQCSAKKSARLSSESIHSPGRRIMNRIVRGNADTAAASPDDRYIASVRESCVYYRRVIDAAPARQARRTALARQRMRKASMQRIPKEVANLKLTAIARPRGSARRPQQSRADPDPTW